MSFKSAVAREVLWFMAALFIAVPIGFFFVWLMDMTTVSPVPSEPEQVFMTQLYLIGYVMGIVAVYIMRIIKFAVVQSIISSKKISESP